MPIVCMTACGTPKAGQTAAHVLAKSFLAARMDAVLFDRFGQNAIWSALPDDTEGGPQPLANRAFIQGLNDLQKRHRYVVVDLQGCSDLLSAIALASADLVLLPIMTRPFNALPSLKALEMLQVVYANRPEPPQYGMFLYQSGQPLSTTVDRRVRKLLKTSPHPLLDSSLHADDAMRFLSSWSSLDRALRNMGQGGTLSDHPPIADFASEVLDLLKSSSQSGMDARARA